MIGEVQYHEDMRPVVRRSSAWYQFVRPTLEEIMELGAQNFDGKPYLNIGGPLVRETAVLAPDHRSNWDSILMASVGYHEAGLELAFLAKEKMWTALHRKAETVKARNPSALMRAGAGTIAKLDTIAKYAIELGGGFPVDQDDPNLVEVAAWGQVTAQQGHSMVIFPEKKRITEKKGYDITKIQKTARGAGLIALQNNIPLQPIAIWGTQDLGMEPWKARRPIVINIGEPLYPTDYTSASPERGAVQISRDMRVQLQGLLDNARQAHAAL